MRGRRLHVTAEHHGRDLDAAEAAASAFLSALGIDVDQEALAETPARMAKAYAELLTGPCARALGRESHRRGGCPAPPDPADVRRLYPDAYGRDYVARRDDYLTSAPVTVFVLVASPSAIGKAKDIKGAIRRLLGDGDALRNHLHMPDSPGDAFADLDHLAGTETFNRLYGRYERDRAAQRLARYRALLEQPDPRYRTG